MKNYRHCNDVPLSTLMSGRIPFNFIKEDELNEVLNGVHSYDRVEAQAIEANEFCFLNKRYVWNNVTEWNPKDVDDPLWKYYLNYFDYGVTLLKAYIFTNNKGYIVKLKELVSSWIDNTKPGAAVSWDPYPTSIRIVNWLVILNKLKDINHDDTEFLNKLAGSIVNQTNFLYNNLEHDLNNNHLTSNAKALIWAGVLLGGIKDSGRWLFRGLKVLNRRFEEEISDDGFQYEASTSYQILAIQDYLETYLLLELNGLSGKIKSDKGLLEKMAEALGSVIYPDGSMPLLNDSVMGYPMNCCELMAACAVFFMRPDFKMLSGNPTFSYLIWLFGMRGLEVFGELGSRQPLHTSAALKDAGFFVMRSGFTQEDTCILFDCGPIGPEHCPGHGHSDALSFELYSFGKQLIVDPGVYSYNSAEYRHFFKSTGSHNTVVLDDMDQSELVGSFRVGNIANAKFKSWSANDGYDMVEGLHTGYRGVTHTRKIEFYKPYDILISDRVEGVGNHKIEAVFILSDHLTEIKEINPENCICIFGDVVLDLSFDAQKKGSLNISDSYISREWNKLIPVKKVTYTIDAGIPICLSTKIKVYRAN